MYNMFAYEKTEEMGNILFSPLFQYFHLRISVLFSCFLCNWENNLSVRPI